MLHEISALPALGGMQDANRDAMRKVLAPHEDAPGFAPGSGGSGGSSTTDVLAQTSEQPTASQTLLANCDVIIFDKYAPAAGVVTTLQAGSRLILVPEEDMSVSATVTSDVVTYNVSSSRHGLTPKLPNDSTRFLDGTGNYSVPPGGGAAGGILTGTYPNPGLATTIPQAESVVVTDGATNSSTTIFTVGHDSSGTPAASFGSNTIWNLASATVADRNVGLLNFSWVTAVDASRAARATFNVYDTASREIWRGEASGSAPKIGFLGNGAVAQQVSGDVSAGLVNYGLLGGSPYYLDQTLKMQDITTNNASNTAHGLLPKGGFVETCQAYNSATQSVNDSTWTVLTFDSNGWDGDTMHSTSVNTSRITFKLAGEYMILGSIGWSSTLGDATHTSGLRLRINGTTLITFNLMASNAGGAGQYVQISTFYKAAANDYVELMAYQTSGAPVTVQAGQSFCALGVALVGTV